MIDSVRHGSSSDCSGSGYYTTALQHLYNIYKRQVIKPFKVILFFKFYEVISVINK